MFLNYFKRFIYKPKGLGLTIFLPVVFLISFYLSFLAVIPFQSILKEEQQIQHFITLATDKQNNDTETFKKEISDYIAQSNNYHKITLAQALLKIKENNTKLPDIKPNDLTKMLHHAFYIQAVLLAFIITLFELFCFFILYITLKCIGPFFCQNINGNTWGRILVFPSILILFIHLIATTFSYSLSISYLMIIDILLSLLLGVYLQKHIKYKV